ncbi:MAG: RHS repeat-associated core domain-containing protein [Rhodanobacter sp.]
MDIQIRGRAVYKTIAYALVLLMLWLGGVVHAGTVTYVYTDAQGTPLAEADASGNITATFDYAPYGSQALGTPPSGPGYTGHVNDPDTGLVYMQARYYDPGTGQFLSPDPVGPLPGNTFNFNRYAYANNNPILNLDADGRLTGSLLHQDERGVAGNGFSIQIASAVKQISNLARGTVHQAVKDATTVSGVRQSDSLSDAALAPLRLGLLFSPLSLEGGASSAALEGGAAWATNSEVTVFRVFGGDARAGGFSWTTENPLAVGNFRDAAGLPSGGSSGATNTADFLIKGRANAADIIKSRSALPLDGNTGGLPELIINPKNVQITDFSVLNP